MFFLQVKSLAAIYLPLFFTHTLATPVDFDTTGLNPVIQGMPSPTVDEIVKDIDDRHKVPPNSRAVFYTGGGTGSDNAALAARQWVKDNPDYLRLKETDRSPPYYDDVAIWNDLSEVQNRWSEAFAKISTGSIIIFFKGDISNKIDPTQPSVWNTYEYPILAHSTRSDVDEIVQISAPNPLQHTVIWPYDARDPKFKDCIFRGDGPDCPTTTACKDSEDTIHLSRWGNTLGWCRTGHKYLCCPKPPILYVNSEAAMVPLW